MKVPIKWDDAVVKDYRQRIIIDPHNPILAFKASRDRYVRRRGQYEYAGRPYLGSRKSEDALTWNVFRSLQKAKRLDVIADRLAIGNPRGLLLWTLAPEVDEINAELQYATGSLIRKFDGIIAGQITEPDVIILGTTGIAVIECKLSEPDKALSHLWEGRLDSVDKRLREYTKEIPHFVKTEDREKIAPVYQLVRMAFYALKLGASFHVEPLLVSLVNGKKWQYKIRKLGKTPSELWGLFRDEILGKDPPRCESLTWQEIRELIYGTSLDALSAYLSAHHCLYSRS